MAAICACGQPGDGWPDDMCQECWERHGSQTWWEEVTAFFATGHPQKEAPPMTANRTEQKGGGMVAHNRLDEFIDSLGLSARAFATLVGSTPGAVNYWRKGAANGGRDIPYWLAKRTGVNYAWLVGDESQMWGERMINLRQSLLAHLASPETKEPADASGRFRLVLAWFRERAPDLVWDECMAARLRVEVAVYREAASATVSVSQEAINRLASFADVPAEWFATGTLLKR